MDCRHPNHPCNAKVHVVPTSPLSRIFHSVQDIIGVIRYPGTFIPSQIAALTPHDCLPAFRILHILDRILYGRIIPGNHKTELLLRLMARIEEGGYFPTDDSGIRRRGVTPYLHEDGEDKAETRKRRELFFFKADWDATVVGRERLVMEIHRERLDDENEELWKDVANENARS